jgi:hypothetical protein
MRPTPPSRDVAMYRSSPDNPFAGQVLYPPQRRHLLHLRLLLRQGVGLARDTDDQWNLQELLDTDLLVTSSGEDEAGELYLTACNCQPHPKFFETWNI